MWITLTLSSIWLICLARLSVGLVISGRRFRLDRARTDAAASKETPTVSVCIAARDEYHAMTTCLEAVLNSTYPKLEIIVADDSSRDATSMIIKSFAHAGVRFVEGEPLKDDWLGKNQTQQRLLDESSGEIIIFMDVDTQIAPTTIETTVRYMQSANAAMVSVIPRRADGWRASVLVAPLRYFWALALSSRYRSAVASSFWMIDRAAFLRAFYGFYDVKDAIQPESIFSDALLAQSAYRTLLSTPALGVTYEKKWSSQIETSVRLLTPLAQRYFQSKLSGLIMLVLIASPIMIVFSAVATGWTMLHTTAAVTTLLFAGLYMSYTFMIWARHPLMGFLAWPYVICQEAIVYMLSWVKYTAGTVTWKGRPIRQVHEAAGHLPHTKNS